MRSPTWELVVCEDRPAMAFRRFFAAPPALSFDAWTEPEHLRHWWGPRSHELIVCEADLRVGGAYRLVQRAPDGHEHAFTGRYLELDRPHRLRRTFTYAAAPEHGAVETVTFEAQPGGTSVLGESVFASYAARDLYTRAGAERGMRESYLQLDQWFSEQN